MLSSQGCHTDPASIFWQRRSKTIQIPQYFFSHYLLRKKKHTNDSFEKNYLAIVLTFCLNGAMEVRLFNY